MTAPQLRDVDEWLHAPLPEDPDVRPLRADDFTVPTIGEPNGDPAAIPARPFPVVRVLQGTPKTPPDLLVDDLILDRDVNNWGGYGGSGKSTSLLHIAVCVPLGLPVFGTLRVRRPGPVLLVVPEDGEAAARMTLDAIIAGLNLSDEAQAQLSEQLVMIPDEITVNITVDSLRLRDTARAIGAVLVILDPLRDLLGGEKENDNDIAGPTIAKLRRDVCRGAGAAVLLSQHLRKPGKDEMGSAAPTIHAWRGGGSWTNGARLAFAVSKAADRITLTALKSNRMRPDLRHDVKLVIDADAENAAHWLRCTLTDANAGAVRADAADFTPGKGRPIIDTERRVLDALDDAQEPGLRLSDSKLHRSSGITAYSTFKAARRRLIDAGLVTAAPTGKRTRNGSTEYSYGITRSGRDALATGWAHESPKGERATIGQ